MHGRDETGGAPSGEMKLIERDDLAAITARLDDRGDPRDPCTADDVSPIGTRLSPKASASARGTVTTSRILLVRSSACIESAVSAVSQTSAVPSGNTASAMSR
jgi:hypothetical protein